MTVVARSYCYAKQKDGFSLTLDDGGQREHDREKSCVAAQLGQCLMSLKAMHMQPYEREGQRTCPKYPQLALETLQAKGHMHSKCP